MKKHLNLILLGSPGAGKGTQADLIARKYKIPHISTGDMFREILKDEVSELAKNVRNYVEAGELVPDEVVLEMVKRRLENNDTQSGFILDGFPRTLKQAESLADILKQIDKDIHLAIYLEASFSIILERLTGRRVCMHCGANYHIKYSPSREKGVCDKCGGELYQREDDKEETIRRRVEVYLEQIEGIIKFYDKKRCLFKVSGDLNADDVFKLVTAQLVKLNITDN